MDGVSPLTSPVSAGTTFTSGLVPAPSPRTIRMPYLRRHERSMAQRHTPAQISRLISVHALPVSTYYISYMYPLAPYRAS